MPSNKRINSDRLTPADYPHRNMETKRIYKAVGAALAILVVLLAAIILAKLGPDRLKEVAHRDRRPSEDALRIAEKLVLVKVTPSFNFSFDFMKPGVLQHLDRQYTYDVVPEELMNGLLFQGIHRPPKGTSIEFELLSPATVYFFFHHEVDGGYSSIFETLPNWQHSDVFPQYDIHNGDHGLKMVMYQLEADAGSYSIPPTAEDRACFNIVFQERRRSPRVISVKPDRMMAAHITRQVQRTHCHAR